MHACTDAYQKKENIVENRNKSSFFQFSLEMQKDLDT